VEGFPVAVDKGMACGAILGLSQLVDYVLDGIRDREFLEVAANGLLSSDKGEEYRTTVDFQ
jgi:hypothetical protein